MNLRYPAIRLISICLIITVVVTAMAAVAADPAPQERFPNHTGEIVYPVVHPTVFRPPGEEHPPTPVRTPTFVHTPTTVHVTTPPPTTASHTTAATMPPSPTTHPVTQTFSATPPSTSPTTIPTAYDDRYRGYRNGPGYSPVYYYPPGYPYYISSYYPDGSLVVTSSPSNAVIILDGYTRETTPYVFTNLVQGYHSVEVDYPGYEAYMTSVYIESGSTNEIDANLALLASYGSLFIDSSPRGADVYVDGNYEGTTATTVSALISGPHQVELHLAGYEVLSRTFDISAGQGTTLDLPLTPYGASSETGSIDVSSNIPGALVYLDGIYKGTVPSGSVFNIVAVAPGSHTILLHLPGYSDYTQMIEITAGRITDVTATFSAQQTVQGAPSAASEGGGSILVSSVPSGGQVWVDNQFRGIAPVTIYNIAAGSHIVSVRLDGYDDWSSNIQVQNSQMVQVPATLTPGAGTIPTQAALPVEVVIAGVCVSYVVLALRRR